MGLPLNFESFGSYVFLKKLADGGMAEVFLARPANQAGNGRIQVIKRLLPHVASSTLFLEMFQTEIQVILGFNHPHVVQLHDFGETEHRPYIAMEYLEGKNLKEVIAKFIQKNQWMPVPMALGLIAQGASGLSYAHTFVNKVTGQPVNAIHRDISPHNLIVSYEGNLKVIDFGIAKAANGNSQEPTTAGTIKGKISYLSPEQVHGSVIDARSDVFSLGVVAWELLTLQRPFTKKNDTEVTIISRINNCDEYIVPPSYFNSEVPPEVDDVILKALKKNPDDRYDSAAEFQNAIRKVMIKYFPNYSYSDTSQMMNFLFEDDISQERIELKDLNQKAQHFIQSDNDTETQLIEPPGVVTGVFNGLRSVMPESDHIDQRILKIENMMKENFSRRHYFIFAIYVVSILIIKFDPQLSFLNFIKDSKTKTQTSAMTSLASRSVSLRKDTTKTKAPVQLKQSFIKGSRK